MSRRKQPNPNKVNPLMQSSEEQRAAELTDVSQSEDPHQSHTDNNETMNCASNADEALTNGEHMETQSAENKLENTSENLKTSSENGAEELSSPPMSSDGDLSSINAMMSAVMSSAVMSSSNMNGADDAEAEEEAASSSGPSPSPSPNKSLTSAMRAPPSRNQRRTQDTKEDSGALICPLCDKSCQNQHQLTMHIRQHNADTGATDHSCSICGKCLSSASSLDRHMLVHSGERPYKCSICGQTFTTNGNMHRHMKIHEKDPASGLMLLSPPSPSPNKRRRPSVKRRLGEEPEEPPPSKKVVEDVEVEDTVTPVRTVEEELPCPICFKILTSRLELDAHMDTHPDTTLRCDMCCLTFRTHRGLLRHNAAVHKLLPLDPSGRPFIQNNPSIPTGFNELAFIDFSCHKFSHIAQVWCETNLRRCISKFHRFVCNLCDRAFPLRSALDLHKTTSHKTHKEERSAAEKSAADEKLKVQTKTEETEQESFLQNVGLQHVSKIPVSPSEADLIQARLDSIKTIPIDAFSLPQEALSLGLPQEALSLGLPLGMPLFQAGFLLQPEGGGPHEAPTVMELADIQQILQVAAAAPNQMGLSLPLKGGVQGGALKSMPPLKPKPPPATRCGLASTPPPLQSSQQASLGCISPSLPPLAQSLFKSPQNTSHTDPESAPTSPDSPPLTTSLHNDDPALNEPALSRKNNKITTNAKGSFSCRFCDQVFAFSGLLQAHMRFHLGILPHQCNICDYVAPDKATLIRHLRTHSGERPYVCRVCHYPFTVKANCERHLRKKHNKTSRKDIEKNIKYVTSTATNNITAALTAAATVANSTTQDTETICRFCGEDLKSYRALQIHLRTHNGCQRKPFECKRCGAAFLAKRNCIHHLLKHHPEVQEREIEEHIATLQPANITAANANISTNRATNIMQINGLQSVKVEAMYASADPDQPLDFSAKQSRDSSGVKLETFDSAAPDQPIDLSIPSKRQRREDIADVKPELTAIAVSSLSKDADKLSANVLACFPLVSSSSVSNLNLRAQRLKPLLPKPLAAAGAPGGAAAAGGKELPPLASIAQIISSVSGVTDLLRSRETVGAVNASAPATTSSGGGATTTGGGAAETKNKMETERETVEEDESVRKRPRKKPVSAKDRSTGIDLESSGEFASVEKMLATTDANKFSTYLQTAELTTKRESSSVAVEEKAGPKDEPKASPPPKGKKNAYSNSAQKMTCPFCPRVFPWASSLQRHMLTHTGQKPFPCPKCDAFFSTKSNCERHLLRKHGVTNRTLRRNGIIVKKEEEASQESAESQSEAEPVNPEVDHTSSKSGSTAPPSDTNTSQSEQKPTPDAAAAETVPDPPQSESSEEQQEALESSSAEKPQNNTVKVESTDDDDCQSNKSLDLNFGRKLIDFKLNSASSGSSQDEQPGATQSANVPNTANANPSAVTSKPEYKHVCRVCKKSFRYSTTLARHKKAHLCEEPAPKQETGKMEEKPTGNQEEDKTEDGNKMAVAEEDKMECKEALSDPEQVKAGESEGETGESDSDEKEKDEERSDEENGTEPKNSDGNRVDKRKKICNVCSKRFWSLQDLTRHMRSHTGERPYQCQTCERTFTLKHSLVRHQRIHLKPRTAEDGLNERANEDNERTNDDNTSEDGDSCTPLSTCAPSENESEPKDMDELETSEKPTETPEKLTGTRDTPLSTCAPSENGSEPKDMDELETSEKPTETPEKPTGTQDTPLSTCAPSENGSEPKDIDELETSEKPTGTPEKPTGTPEKPTGTPEKPTGTPEKPTGTPEKPTGTPEKPTGTPEKSTETPEKPTETRDKPTGTQDKPTGTEESTLEYIDKSEQEGDTNPNMSLQFVHDDAEESQAEESQAEESQVEESQAEESQVEEKQAEESISKDPPSAPASGDSTADSAQGEGLVAGQMELEVAPPLENTLPRGDASSVEAE